MLARLVLSVYALAVLVCIAHGTPVRAKRGEPLRPEDATEDEWTKYLDSVDKKYRDEEYYNSMIALDRGKAFHSKKSMHLPNPDEQIGRGSDGDMVLTHVQEVKLGLVEPRAKEIRDRRKRTVKAVATLWPGALVPWKYNPDHLYKHNATRKKIEEGIAGWEADTCIRFKRRDDLTEGVLLVGDGRGCSSTVGMVPKSKLTLSESSPMCLVHGTIQHEFGHSLGFLHEQSRMDRDKYIRVNFENIYNTFYARNFFKTQHLDVNKYDLESDMHYSSTGFAEYGTKTIETLDPELEFLIGQRRGLTFYDIKAANIAYKCTADCTNECHNDGYPFKTDQGACICKCPYGLAGECTEIDTSVADACSHVYKLTSNGQRVTINSPNYPNNYDTGKTCLYFIQAPEGHMIIMNFKDFEVTENTTSETCIHYLEIRSNIIGQTGVRYCGDLSSNPAKLTPMLNHNASSIMLIFDTTQDGDANKGFSLDAIVKPDPCHQVECLNYGRCVATDDNSYLCLCADGFLGATCKYNDVEVYTCDFDNGKSCGWTQDVNPDDVGYIWQAETGPTLTYNTGPLTGVMNSTYYYAEASGANEGDVASLKSGYIKAGKYCVSFYWHMNGRVFGEFSFSSQVDGQEPVKHFVNTRDHGDVWFHEFVAVHHESDFKMSFNSVHGPHYIADVALDSVVVAEKDTCQPTTTRATCDFDDGKLCDWKQSKDDDIDWIPKTGRTLTLYTGPTTGVNGTPYIYTEASYDDQGDKATIKAGWLPAGKYCVSFYYHMYGSQSGSLYFETLAYGGTLKKRFETSGDQGDNWIKRSISVDEQTYFDMSFTSVLGSGRMSDVGLDSIEVLENTLCAIDQGITTPPPLVTTGAPVSSSVTCDFNTDSLCGWSQEQNDDFDWTFSRGETPTYGSGPKEGIDNTAYIYAEATGVLQGYKAVLTTTNLIPAGKYCFSFQYNMYGSDMGDLHLTIKPQGEQTATPFVKSGDQGLLWHLAKVSIDKSVPFKLSFTAVRGSRWKSDIALDSVNLEASASC